MMQQVILFAVTVVPLILKDQKASAASFQESPALEWMEIPWMLVAPVLFALRVFAKQEMSLMVSPVIMVVIV